MPRSSTWVGAAALLVLSTWVVIAAPPGNAPGASGGAAEGSSATQGPDQEPAAKDTTYANAARRVGSVVPEEPLEVRLPSGTRVRVVGVSSDESGKLSVPSDLGSAGWWRGGSRVGDPFGSTLVAAHVDSTTQGLGPFAELLHVRRGDHIRLASRHLVQVFEVSSLRTVAQGRPTDDWMFASRGPRRLTLVTCAPPYDQTRGGYQKLAVVVAVPVVEPRARQARR